MAYASGIRISSVAGVIGAGVGGYIGYTQAADVSNLSPVAGALILGFGLYTGSRFVEDGQDGAPRWASVIALALLLPAGYALIQVVLMQQTMAGGAMRIEPAIENWHYGAPLILATVGAIALSWFPRQARHQLLLADVVLMVCAAAVAGYLLVVFNSPLRASTTGLVELLTATARRRGTAWLAG